jgi:lysozyme family protein
MSRADDLFALASAIVLEEEGVFSNDPGDPGGETWFGLARASHPDMTPWPPTKEQALQCYRAEYFDAHRCGEMPAHWAVAIFDAVVNPCGPVIQWAQRALGVKGDGSIGAVTLAAMSGTFADESLDLFMTMRVEGYLKQPNYETGHIRRLFAVQRMTLQRAP